MNLQELGPVIEKFREFAEESGHMEEMRASSASALSTANRVAAAELDSQLPSIAQSLADQSNHLQVVPTADDRGNKVVRLLWGGPGQPRILSTFQFE